VSSSLAAAAARGTKNFFSERSENISQKLQIEFPLLAVKKHNIAFNSANFSEMFATAITTFGKGEKNVFIYSRSRAGRLFTRGKSSL
jgi:hypothetical protein